MLMSLMTRRRTLALFFRTIVVSAEERVHAAAGKDGAGDDDDGHRDDGEAGQHDGELLPRRQRHVVSVRCRLRSVVRVLCGIGKASLSKLQVRTLRLPNLLALERLH